MKSFIEFEKDSLDNTLFIFDIDDTLFKTNARVFVKDPSGKVIDRLSNQDFNTHTLLPGQSYEFSEFENANMFDMTSRPIKAMLDKVKHLQKKIEGTGSLITFITGRSDFDDKEKFLNVFRKRKIDIDKIHVHRVGNDRGPETLAVKKAKVTTMYLATGKYKTAEMYDDSKENLEEFKSLQSSFPDVSFSAFQVFHNGTSKQL